ncbi:MAG: hypothetical protein ACLVKR_04715 [Lachnospiraceae bacterium]
MDIEDHFDVIIDSNQNLKSIRFSEIVSEISEFIRFHFIKKEVKIERQRMKLRRRFCFIVKAAG